MTIGFDRNVAMFVALMLACAPVAACAKGTAQAATGGAAATSPGMTLQQFQQRHEKKIMAADTDGDGRVSKAEFLATAKAGKHDPAARFAKLDLNGDGMLDRSEIDTMLAKRFKHLDTNGDGVLSAAERAAAHAGKGKAGGDSAT